jgi:hypothetical protein
VIFKGRERGSCKAGLAIVVLFSFDSGEVGFFMEVVGV